MSTSTERAFALADQYLNSLPRPGKLSKGKSIALAFFGALLAGCNVAMAAQATDQGPLPTDTPLPSDTPTPDNLDGLNTAVTASPTATATLTDTAPIASLVPTLTAGIIAEKQAFSISTQNNGLLSDYPSSMNAAGNESTGESDTTVEQIIDYLTVRRVEVDTRVDLAYRQWENPVNPAKFKDRGLGFGQDGFGMGFSQEDDSNFKENSKNGTVEFKRSDNDGYYRASVKTNARNFEGMVHEAIVNFLKHGNGNVEPGIVEVRGIFNQIIFTDWEVEAQDDGDGKEFTLNDNFMACETFMGGANTRLAQPELARKVTFLPDLEFLNDRIEQEEPGKGDTDTGVVLKFIHNGEQLWAEFYQADNRPDTVNGTLEDFGEINGSRISLRRLVPCGVGVSGENGVVNPEVTPGPTEKSEPSEHNPEGNPQSEPGNLNNGENSNSANNEVNGPSEK